LKKDAMTSRSRYALIALSTLGLAASCAALYVHYQFLTDPSYSSFCDVNESVACQQTLQSSYATMAGIPVAAGGAIWSALVLMLSAWGMRKPASDGATRAAGYVFLLSVAGLAAVFYLGYASFFVLGQVCPICVTMYVSVVGIFLISASAAGPLRTLQTGLSKDLTGLAGSPMAAALAGIWLAASAGLLLAFPREQPPTANGATSPSIQATPVETLAPEQLAELHAWVDRQPRVPDAQPSGDVKVLLLKFNDYQCPSCRQAWMLYQDIITRYENAHPGVFQYESRDFPLEPECGAGGVHGAACEAAVAVRMAREKNMGKQVEAALFERQSPSMTREDVKSTLSEVAQISASDFDARYPTLLEAVRADAQLGQKLGVSGTPTFFLNGIRLGSFRPVAFEAVLAYELKKAGVTGP
jgi:uncharacterized membrane protein/protein-disulfide isomerase